MNEIKNNLFIIIVIIVLSFCSALGGFIFGRNNLLRSPELADTDKQLERTISGLREELEREHDISAGLREINDRERAVINRLARNTQQARNDIGTVITISGTAAESLQNIIVKMEILNGYIGNNERELARYRDLSSD